jgi:hypothetical protein
MMIRFLLGAVMAAVVIGIAIAFLWVQVGLPAGITYTPWDSPIGLFPSLFAFWIPLIYLFFTSLWFTFALTSLSDQEQLFFKLDQYTYLGAFIFFLLQAAWKDLGSPELWLRGFVLILLIFKGFLLCRMLYHSAHRIQPIVLVIFGVGFHILIALFTYQPLSMPITDLWRHTELRQLALLSIKSLCLNLMTLEMFRLGSAMTKSVQSAFFSWLIVTFTFPVLGFPKMSYILAGLLISFILRMIFSRLDTRELMVGLLTPSRIMILLKLLVVFVILLAAGLVFWSNAKPGFELRGGRAFQTAMSTFFDGQFGVFCYAPLYWLALVGAVYPIFFRVWDGILLLLTGGTLYYGYHLAFYGMLGRSIEQSDSVPFLSILGVFMAIAHTRFGKMMVFRGGIRFAAIVTVGITALLILLYPDFPLVSAKIAEIERVITVALGTDITAMLPSTVFNPFSTGFFLWIGVITGMTIVFCYSRTRSASLLVRKAKTILAALHVQESTFAPGLFGIFLMIGGLSIHYGDHHVSVPLSQPIQLSSAHPQTEIVLNNSFSSTGLFIVSNLTESLSIPHGTPVASVLVVGQDQRFETFTLKIGQDTSEETLEQPEVKSMIAHGRAAIYRSWNVKTADGTPFTAHEYYTKFSFSRPFQVQTITLKLFDLQSEDPLSDVTLHIKAIALLD